MTKPLHTVVVDYGSGNLHSISKALIKAAAAARVPHAVTVSADAASLDRADHIVLPGVGAYRDCMEALTAIPKMRDALERNVQAKSKPFLGVCVGMQLLTERGFEHGECEGLGWIRGETRAMSPGEGLPVPHMGWNDVIPTGTDGAVTCEAGDAYFVHSYVVRPSDPAAISAECVYGSERFACALKQGALYAVQFHPEKSRDYGIALLTRFLEAA